MRVVRLSDIPEEKRKEFTDLMDKNLPRPFEKFNEFGLRYSTEHLATMNGSIVMLPLEYAANYVDAIFKKQVDDNDLEYLSAAASLKHGQILKSDNEFAHMNCTAVGNLAYAILNSKDQEVSDVFMEFYQAYADWYSQMVDLITDEDLKKLAQLNGASEEDYVKYFKQGINAIKKMRE